MAATPNPSTSRRPDHSRADGGVEVGRLFGIPVRLDWSWMIIFLLITWSVSRTYGERFASWTHGEQWMAGVITSLAFFLSILLHEMGHSLVARRFGIQVASITLFIFGGVAAIRRDPRRPREEFWIAIAGPAVSLFLCAFLYFFHLLISGDLGAFLSVSRFFAGMSGAAPKGLANMDPIRAMLITVTGWVAGINLALVLFNMIPGFPLDGGRVLRSILWAASGDYVNSTRRAALGGQIFAGALILLGALEMIFSGMGGLWFIFLGIFLVSAAQGSVAQIRIRQRLREARALDLADPAIPAVSPAMSAQSLLELTWLRYPNQEVFAVYDGERIRGMIPTASLSAIPREDWETTSAQALMIPVEELPVVRPFDTAEAALEAIEESAINAASVVENGVYFGLVSRDAIVRFLQSPFPPRSHWQRKQEWIRY